MEQDNRFDLARLEQIERRLQVLEDPAALTELVDAAPEGDQWLHEIKFDGYRMPAP